MTRRWSRGLLVTAGLFCLLSIACSSPEDRIDESLEDWDATVIRYSWDCGAMAASLERWLEMNEEPLREDVLALAAAASEMDPEERAELFEEITTSDRSKEAEQKLAACGDNEDVLQQLHVMTDILLPIMMLDGPPQPSPPTPDATEEGGAPPVQ